MRRSRVTTLLLLVVASPASAVEVRGYVRSEFAYGHLRADALTNRLDATRSELHPMLEANLEIEHTFADTMRLYLDGGGLLDTESTGNRVLFNEALAEVLAHDHFELWLGKRRVSFGTGLAFSPVDVIYAAKNPTDPNLQREGRIGAGFVVPFDWWSVSFVWAPSVSYADLGLPDAIDLERHSFVGAVYLNVLEADLNLLYLNIEERHHGGFSFSRYVTDDLEVHGEALVMEHRPEYGLGLPSSGPPPGAGAAAPALGLDDAPVIDTDGVYLRALGGVRWSFLDGQGTLNLEYLYNGAGYSGAEYDRLLKIADAVARAVTAGLVSEELTAASEEHLSGLMLPGRLRQHYLALSVSANEVWDYFNLIAVCIWGLDDLSALVQGAVEYRLADAVVLRLSAAVPLGEADTQFGLIPFDAQVAGRVSVFF